MLSGNTIINLGIQSDTDADQDQIIHLGSIRGSLLKHLIEKYMRVEYKGFNLLDLARMSLSQWKQRKYFRPAKKLIKISVSS